MYDLHYCIYSLLNQSLKPDEVILWLGKEQFLDKKISRKVLDLQKNGLTIKWCNDIKSYKKLIPALQEYPNDIIVTADDDVFYEKDWLKDLYEEYLENPNYIHAKRVHKFSLNKPYNSWQQLINDNTISFFNFPTTGAGVLYPPNLLYKDVLNKDLFMELSPNADDIWFWAMALLQGTKIKVCKKPMNTLRYTTPERAYGLYDEKTLCSLNCGQNQNDKQIESVLNHFPKIIEVLKNDKS